MFLQRLFRILWLLCTLLSICLLPTTALRAQETTTITIDQVDHNNYPTIQVKFDHQGLTKAQVSKLQLLENGQPVKIQSIKTKPVHVTVYLDDYKNLGVDALVRAANALDSFDHEAWLGKETTFSLWTNTSTTDIAATINSTLFMRDLVNTVQSFPLQNLGTTATDCAITKLLTVGTERDAQNYLVVLSNGFDPTEAPKCDVASETAKHDVTVILVSTRPDVPSGRDHFSKLANGSNPLYLNTDACLSVPCSNFNALWQQIARQRTSTLTYFTTQGEITDITLRAKDDLSANVEGINKPTITVAPVQIQLLTPTSDFVTSDTKIDAEVQIHWPEKARKLASIEYSLDQGDWQTLDLAKVDSAQKLHFSIPDLTPGKHSLSVRVIETIPGLASEQSVNWQINAPPTATPLPTPTLQPTSVPEPVQIKILKPSTTVPVNSTTVAAEVQLIWQGAARQLTSLEYSIDDLEWRSLNLKQIDIRGILNFVVPNQEQGKHSLAVRAIESSAIPISEQTIQWSIALPPSPIPSPTVMPTRLWEPFVQARIPEKYQTQVSSSLETLSLWPWQWIFIASALLFGLVSLWQLRRVFQRIEEPNIYIRDTTNNDLPTTIGFMPEDVPLGELILIQGDGLVPGVIVLRQTVTKIGRDFRSVHEVLSSRYVSHHQFTIREDRGVFTIENGSTEHFTMINGIAISKESDTLKNGDVISFGPFKYRFYATSHPVYYTPSVASNTPNAAVNTPLPQTVAMSGTRR